MKKYFLLYWGLFLFFMVNASAQVINGGVSLLSQEMVDTMYKYTEITGYLRIDAQYITRDGDYELGHNIKNLYGLSNLTSVGGGLSIWFTDSLENVDGLSNLKSVGHSLIFRFNDGLKNINGLSNLNYSSIKLLWLDVNPNLENISSLQGITSLDTLWIDNNFSLKTLDAFSNIRGQIIELKMFYNGRLTNLEGLSGITSIRDSLLIAYESSLTNLDALSNLQTIGGDLKIYNNPSLKRFCGLYTLLSNNGLGGDFNVHDNKNNPTKDDIISCGACSGISEPIANAGPDQLAVQGVTLQLDGSASSDPQNNQLYYSWSIVYTPLGSNASLSNETIVSPTFNSDSTGYYTIQLTVSNGCEESAPDLVSIQVLSIPDAIQNPIDSVATLPLNDGNKNALTSKLQNALARYNAGDYNAAKNILNAFINQLNQFIANGTLTSAEAQPLIDFANQIIDAINSMLPKAAVQNSISEIPTDYALYQNYPNPFNPTASIKYAIPNSEFVSLKVYDILGNEVANLVEEHQPAGNYEIKFDGSKLSSGMYIYKLTVGTHAFSKKMLLIK